MYCVLASFEQKSSIMKYLSYLVYSKISKLVLAIIYEEKL